MSFLQQFSGPERALIIALPYRVGVWVSLSDQTGGREASIIELATLARVLQARTQGSHKSAFLQEVMTETYGRRPDWPDWRGQIERVPDECRRVLTIMEGRLLTGDIAAYRQTLILIARDVARAFREADVGAGPLARLFRSLRIAGDRFIGFVRGEEYESAALLNISEQEDIALATLARALRAEEEG